MKIAALIVTAMIVTAMKVTAILVEFSIPAGSLA